MNEHSGMPIMHHRRDIVRGCLRCGGLLALGGLATALAWRGRCGAGKSQGTCGACNLLPDCVLPQALQQKRADQAAASKTPSHVRNA